MKPRARILAYNNSSKGAIALGKRTGIKRLRPPRRRTYQGRPSDIIFNWGCSNPVIPGPLYINPPHSVGVAIDKYNCLLTLRNRLISCVNVTTDFYTAQEWARSKHGVIIRYLGKSSGGKGAVFFQGTAGEFERITNEESRNGRNVSFWSKYVPKATEFRVHVWMGEVFDVQEKRLRSGAEPNKIRSYENGYVFAREDVSPHRSVPDIAVQAVNALKLDFGAVDIGWTENTQTARVYEINTSPGLEGTTLDLYANKVSKTWEDFRDSF